MEYVTTPSQPSIPGWVGVLVSTQIEQPGSWGPFPSQLLGGRDLDMAKGLGWEVEWGRSCPTVGNNGGAAFRGSKGGGQFLAVEGRQAEAPTPCPTSSTLVLGLKGLEWRAVWRRGACHSPAQRPLPQSLGGF